MDFGGVKGGVKGFVDVGEFHPVNKMRRLQLPKLAKLAPYLAKQYLAKISRIHENNFNWHLNS